MNQIARNLMLLSVITMVVFSAWQSASATTYRAILKRSHSAEKSAQTHQEEEGPVLVNYEVGDTSNFYTERGKAATSGDQDDWEDFDTEEEGIS